MADGEGALDRYWAALKAAYREDYSEVAADHMVFPRNYDELIEHNAFGIGNDEYDHTIAMWLNIEDGVIAQIAFSSEDCLVCKACGSVITELARTSTLDKARAITTRDVIENLEGLPEKDRHCAQLAVNTLQAAIRDYFDRLGKEI
jgi:nitrogen fixation NifU-like protein